MNTPVAEAFQAHHAELVHYCANRLGDTMLAEDIAQQVWLELMRTSYEERGQLRAYVYTIARSRMIDLIRQRQRRPEERLVETPVAFEDDVIIRRVDRRATALLSTLPPRYATVLRLRFIEDRSLAEVAQLLGQTVGSIKALQHRALEVLRERIDP